MEQENQHRSLADLIFLFVEFSFMGWIYEVTLAFIYGWGFVNRGFLHGPFLPIYGFGGVLLVLALGGLMKKDLRVGRIKITPILVFLGIVLITTTIELLAGLLIDQLLAERLWDYTHYTVHYKGIIALNTSLRFGAGGLFMLYVLLPLFTHLTNRLTEKTKNIVAGILVFYLMGDFFITIFSA